MNVNQRALGENSLWRASDHPDIYPELSGEVTADLVIVGGGYTGCSAALHAAKSGARVVLLEAAEIGYGGSGRNAGLVNAGLWLSPDTVAKRLGEFEGERLNIALMQAPELVFSLINEHGIECDARRRGTLQCSHSKSGFEQLCSRLNEVAYRGGKVPLLSNHEARERVGTQHVHGALYDPGAGTI